MALPEAMAFDPAAKFLQAPVAAPFPTSRIIANDHIPKNIERHSTLLHHAMLQLTIVPPWRRLIIQMLEKASPYTTPPCSGQSGLETMELGMAKDGNR